jgi:hypothetical protein
VGDVIRRRLSHLSDAQFGFWYGRRLMQRAAALAVRGESDEALAALDAGQAAYTAVSGGSALPTMQATVALGVARYGRVAEAEELLARARAPGVLGERWNVPIVCIAESVVAHEAGERERAGRAVAEAIAVATEQEAHALAARAAKLAGELGLRGA